MKSTLNKKGLQKVIEYLEREVPGISKKLRVEEGRLIINGTGVELVARVPISELVEPIKPGGVGDTTPIPGAKDMDDPALMKTPGDSRTPIGKNPNNTANPVNAVGRAAAGRAQEMQVKNTMDRMRQFFPDNKQLAQTFATLAQNLMKPGGQPNPGQPASAGPTPGQMIRATEGGI